MVMRADTGASGAAGFGPFPHRSRASTGTNVHARTTLGWRKLMARVLVAYACADYLPRACIRSVTARTTLRLEPPELLFVRLGELIAEQPTKGRLLVADHLVKLFSIQVPVTKPGGQGEQRALLQRSVELRLQAVGIELGQHGIEGDTHARERGHLVIPQILERVLER